MKEQTNISLCSDEAKTSAKATAKVKITAKAKKHISHNTIISTISLLISLTTFFLSIFPQINPFSADYSTKAKAGHLASQIYLADYYFEVGDIANCYNWNKTIARRKNKYTAKAENNLAYLNLTYGFQEKDFVNYYDKAAVLFSEALEAGEDIAGENLYKLLISHPDDLFTSIDKSDTLYMLSHMQNDPDKYQDAFSGSPEWQFVATFQTFEPLAEYSDDFWNICVGSKTVAGITFYTYMQYKVRAEIPIVEYTYCLLEK